MRISRYLAGALIVLAHALPAAAVPKRPEPLPVPRELPVVPVACSFLSNHDAVERRPCDPPSINPRRTRIYVPPRHEWLNCCRTSVTLYPAPPRRPNIVTQPE